MPTVEKIIELNYAPLPHQQAVHDNVAPERLMMWPVGGGKNICGCAETAFLTYEHQAEWQERTQESPKWQIGVYGPTYSIIEQWQSDLLNMLPSELVKSSKDKEVILKNGAVYKFVSCDNPANIVSFGNDIIVIDEAGDISNEAYELIMGRTLRQGRTAIMIFQGTPRGQYDKQVPGKFHWTWQKYLESLRPENKDRIKAFYWFADKIKFGGLEHPILSLTAEGRAKLDRARNDQAMSERKFAEDFLGECLPALTGVAVTPRYDERLHVAKLSYQPRYPLYRSWDFGRHYPVVIFHQLVGKHRTWHILREFCPIQQDLLDVELAEKIIEFTEINFPNHGEVIDVGDAEGNQKTDQRRSSTVTELYDKYKISMLCPVKKPGQDGKVLNIVDGHLRLLPDREPALLIDESCVLTRQSFNGQWLFETGKSGDFTWRKSTLAENHPYIDIWDSIKYFVLQAIEGYTAESEPANNWFWTNDELASTTGRSEHGGI